MRINDKGILIGYHDDPDVTRLVIPPMVKKIAPHAFYGAEYLEEIVVSEGVTEIGAEAFQGCHELRKFVMPDSVKKMGKRVFMDCRRLSEVRISAGLSAIPEGTFDNCHSLASADIPEGVEHIGEYAFNVCVSMKSAELPDSLREISHGAFSETFSLKSLHLPDGISCIENYTFFRSGLEHIIYRGMDVRWENDDVDEWLRNFCFSDKLPEWLESGGKGSGCVPPGLRMPFLLAYFVKTRSPAAGEFVKKNFPKLCTRSIRLGDICAVTAFIEEGFISTRNITRYINMASELGRHEIYLMLMSHKERLGGFGGDDSSARFRL